MEERVVEDLIVEDGGGRRLALRPLDALGKLRLLEAAGPVLSGNDRWLGMAALACSVVAIDGVPQPLPASKAGVEALVERLGEAGIEAVSAALGADDGADLAMAGN